MTKQATYNTLSFVQKDRILIIKINREPQLNALNAEVLNELEDVLYGQIDPNETRVVILEGSGTRAFAAGADIASMESMSPAEARDFSRHGQMITKTLESLPQITIAKVRGYALGGGLELVMACDIVIAGQSAKFGQPEVNLGLIPGFGGTQRLPRRVGLPIALDLLLCGKARSLSGTEAHQVGLVSRVVPDNLLDEEVEKVARAILAVGPKASAEVKRLAREAYSMTLDAGLNAEASAFAGCFAEFEAQEGMRAFLEKRDPDFQDTDHT